MVAQRDRVIGEFVGIIDEFRENKKIKNCLIGQALNTIMASHYAQASIIASYNYNYLYWKACMWYYNQSCC